MSNITAEESMFLQSLAMTSLFIALFRNDFLESDYFNELSLGNLAIKDVLKKSGIGNPAAMQMMLYALLVVPKELLPEESYGKMKDINSFVSKWVEKETFSNYGGEDDVEKIDYLRHIRNAVAHSKCSYLNENEINYVIFSDKKLQKECSIKIKCSRVDEIINWLQIFLIKCYNEQHK